MHFFFIIQFSDNEEIEIKGIFMFVYFMRK